MTTKETHYADCERPLMVAQLLMNGVLAASVYALAALSFGLIYRVSRFFHFAHGAAYAAGAYLAFAFASQLHVPLLLASLLSVGCVAMLGLAMDLLVYRPLRKRRATNLTLLLASLGLYAVLQNAISLVYGDSTRTLRTWEIHEGIAVLGARVTPVQLLILAASISLFLTTWTLVNRTRLGKAFRAVSNDPELALACGIDSDRVVLWAMGVGSALAAGAAILVSLDIDMTPAMGMHALMMGVIALIVGGVESIPGAALGALVLGLAQHLGVWRLQSEWQDSIAFLVLLLFILLRPQGILGRSSPRSLV